MRARVHTHTHTHTQLLLPAIKHQCKRPFAYNLAVLPILKEQVLMCKINRCGLREARLRTIGNRNNGGFLENEGDDEKTPSRNEMRLEYSLRFCATILIDHLSLAPWPPLKNPRDDRLPTIALDHVPIIAMQPCFDYSATNGTFFNVLDKTTSPTL